MWRGFIIGIIERMEGWEDKFNGKFCLLLELVKDG